MANKKENAFSGVVTDFPMINENTKQLRDRYHGALLGLAAGDALGTTLEFRSPGTFGPLTDMVGGGPFALAPGQWTDDTSMALCLGESLVRCHGFDPKDQMERYCRWWQEGYLSCTGRCFDIGLTVSAALSKYTETSDPFSGSVDPRQRWQRQLNAPRTHSPGVPREP